MSDENHAGGQAQPPAPAPGGFDWLIEAHQETTASTSASDTNEAPAPPTLTFAAVPPVAAQPSVVPPPATVAPAAPPVAPQPAAVLPSAPAYQDAVPRPEVLPPAAPQPSTPSAPPTPSGFEALFTAPSQDGIPQAPFVPSAAPTSFALERHVHEPAPTNTPLDWIALGLAIILPPIGLIAAIAAAFLGARNRGFATTVAKAAIGVGAALTVVGIVAAVVGVNLANQQAKHDAIAASSVAYCTKLKANPGTLQSPTFGWPAPADTVPDTITGMQAYESTWQGLEKVAPAGILSGTRQVASTAQSIIDSVQKNQVFDDSSDVAEMTSAASASGITAWVSEYCS